jgi:hypothetical protein
MKKDITDCLGDYTDSELRDFVKEQRAKWDRVNRESYAKKERISSRIRTIQQELDRRKIPTEPETGSVIRFGRRLSGRRYSYAGIRVDNGWWYITGSQNQPFTWVSLLQFIRQDDALDSSHVIDVYPRVNDKYTITLDAARDR